MTRQSDVACNGGGGGGGDDGVEDQTAGFIIKSVDKQTGSKYQQNSNIQGTGKIVIHKTGNGQGRQQTIINKESRGPFFVRR